LNVEKKGRKRGNGEDKPDDLGRKGNQSKIGLSSPPNKERLKFRGNRI
jgi:hypothetical protein